MDNNENNQQMNQNQYNGGQQTQQQYSQTNYTQQPFTPQYQAPMYQPPIEDTTPLSVGQWMLTTLVLGLPCIGLIMGFVWAFGDGNVNRKNFARSFLIWEAIGIGVGILFVVLIGGIAGGLAGLMNEVGNSYYYY